MERYLNIKKTYLNKDLKNLKILRRYIKENPKLYNRFKEDVFESNVLKRGKYDEIIRSRQTIEIINGYMMEAFIVSKANEDIEVLKKIFKIATKRSNLPNEKFVIKYKPIGTGFLSTMDNYPQYYNPHSNEDILFLRHDEKSKEVNPALVLHSTEHASIQIKAIKNKKNLKDRIIYKIINGKYSNVITCLEYDEKYHTKDKCLDILDKLKDEKKVKIKGKKYSINKDVRSKVKKSIFCPEDLGIEQTEVNQYIKFIEAWYMGADGLGKEFYDNVNMAITLLDKSINGRKNNLAFAIADKSIYNKNTVFRTSI